MNKEIIITDYDKEIRKEHRLVMRSYAGFLMAVIMAIISKPLNSEYLWLILSLLSLSVTSAISSVNIENMTAYGKSKNSNLLCFMSRFFVFIPSIAAFSIIIATISCIAGAIFATASLVWFATILRVRRNGGY